MANFLSYDDDGRSFSSSGEEGLPFGRRAPGLRLKPLYVPSRSYSGNSRVEDHNREFPVKDFKTYDEFCSMLRDDYEHHDESVQEIEVIDECATPVNPKKLSLIDNWRSGISGSEIGPPKSPFLIADFASSPVAAINFASLQVTSFPPCDDKAYSRLRSCLSEVANTNEPDVDDASNAIVNQPTHFYDLYDADLERMIDETIYETSSSDDVASTAVYVPPAPSKNPAQRTTKLSSVIRWLPKRLKYTFLSKSSSVQRGLQTRH